jgi:uncharacterized OB-fold protein
MSAAESTAIVGATTPGPDIPLPPPTDLTRPYWAACAEGRLIVPRCGECGRCFFRPEFACTHCASQQWSWVESAGKGSLYSFSVVHRAPSTAFPLPYVLAAVDVDEGFTMFSNVVGCDPGGIRIGMRLRVVFRPVRDGIQLPMFQPDET